MASHWVTGGPVAFFTGGCRTHCGGGVVCATLFPSTTPSQSFWTLETGTVADLQRIDVGLRHRLFFVRVVSHASTQTVEPIKSSRASSGEPSLRGVGKW